MKQHILSGINTTVVILLLILFGRLEGAVVTVYQGDNFTGASQTFDAGEYDTAVLAAGVGNDAISSIQVQAGYKVIIYADAAFYGSPRILTGNVSALSSMGWDNRISSLKVAQDVAPSSMTLDMVHHNPGEPLFDSKFNNPAFIKSMGYDGKVFYLFHSAHLAVDWHAYNPNIPISDDEQAWVAAKRDEINTLYAAAKAAGIKVYCMSDLILLPKSVINYYGISATFGDITNSTTQTLLRAQLQMMFDQFPDLDGIVVRIGETYLQDAPYHSGSIKNNTSTGTIIPLMEILRDEVCVKRNKTVIFRSWLSFDTNLTTYMAVSNAVQPHEKLFIGVKYCEGDFHRAQRFSRVLGAGRHKQIVEVQCQREYEGKGAYPNYVANGVIKGFEEYQYMMSAADMQALKEFAKSPNYAGVWTWTRGGGWDGPYLTKGDWEIWCDLNAWVMVQWAKDTTWSEEDIFNEYATTKLGLSGQDLTDFRQLCLLSAQACVRGRRDLYGTVDRWWSRDQYMSKPPLSYSWTSSTRQRVLDEKAQAETMWGQIVTLADQINFADANIANVVRTSSRYGQYVYKIYRIGFNLVDLAQDVTANRTAIDSLLAEYDQTWGNYRQFKVVNPQCGTLYTEMAFRNVYSGSIAEFVASIRTFPELSSDLLNPSFEDNTLTGSSDFQDTPPLSWVENGVGKTGVIGEDRTSVVDTPYGMAWLHLQGQGAAAGQVLGSVSLIDSEMKFNYIVTRRANETVDTDHVIKIVAGSSATYVGGMTLAEFPYTTPLAALGLYNIVSVSLTPTGDPGVNDTLWMVFENNISGDAQLHIDGVSYQNPGQGWICETYPEFDWNKNCIVDFGDLAIFSSHWLECGRYPETQCP